MRVDQRLKMLRNEELGRTHIFLLKRDKIAEKW
jgi:hypothetical protein